MPHGTGKQAKWLLTSLSLRLGEFLSQHAAVHTPEQNMCKVGYGVCHWSSLNGFAESQDDPEKVKGDKIDLPPGNLGKSHGL